MAKVKTAEFFFSHRLTGFPDKLTRHWPSLLKTLANIEAVVKVKTIPQKLAYVQAKALVDLQANALAEIQMQTHWLRWKPWC